MNSKSTSLVLGLQALEASNFSQAYDYFTRAVEEDMNNALAWKGKGLSAGWQSNLHQQRFQEMVSCYDMVLRLDNDRSSNSIARDMAEGMIVVAYEVFSLSRQHLMEFISVHQAKFDHFDLSEECIGVVERALKDFPDIEGGCRRHQHNA